MLAPYRENTQWQENLDHAGRVRLPYEVKALNLPKGEQREPWFLALNPNGKI